MTDCTGIAFDISFQQEWLVKITFYMGTKCHNLTQASAGILKWEGLLTAPIFKTKERNKKRERKGKGRNKL